MINGGFKMENVRGPRRRRLCFRVDRDTFYLLKTMAEQSDQDLYSMLQLLVISFARGEIYFSRPADQEVSGDA